jgi:hypothetical protein
MKATHLRTRLGDFIVLTNSNSVTTIPADPANTDYAAIMALVAAGELTIADAAPVEAPQA